MILLNHLTVYVSSYTASRDWYVHNFDFRDAGLGNGMWPGSENGNLD